MLGTRCVRLRGCISFNFLCLTLISSTSSLRAFSCQSQGSEGSWSRNAELLSLLASCLIASLAVASQKYQQSHAEYNVYFSSRGSCGDAKVDSERQSWNDLSGMSRQKVLKDFPKASSNARLHAYTHSGSWLLSGFEYSGVLEHVLDFKARMQDSAEVR